MSVTLTVGELFKFDDGTELPVAALAAWAAGRGPVILKDGRSARLFYWPDRGDRGLSSRMCVVELDSGAKLNVPRASIRLGGAL